jgi:hypothetical protein
LTGAVVARTFLGAHSARAFLYDRENSSLLFPSPSTGSTGVAGFMTESAQTSSCQAKPAENQECNDNDGMHSIIDRVISFSLMQITRQDWTQLLSSPTSICRPTPFRLERLTILLMPRLTLDSVDYGFWREFRARGPLYVCQLPIQDQVKYWEA